MSDGCQARRGAPCHQCCSWPTTMSTEHPNILFLSYVGDILFVACDLEEVNKPWASVEEGLRGPRFNSEPAEDMVRSNQSKVHGNQSKLHANQSNLHGNQLKVRGK